MGCFYLFRASDRHSHHWPGHLKTGCLAADLHREHFPAVHATRPLDSD